MVSASACNLSGELATNANDKSLPLRIVVQITAPFLIGPSSSATTETAKF